MRGLDLRGLALTLVLGAIGGIAAHAAHLPLGYLLGSMVLVGTLALCFALAAWGYDPQRGFGQLAKRPGRGPA